MSSCGDPGRRAGDQQGAEQEPVQAVRPACRRAPGGISRIGQVGGEPGQLWPGSRGVRGPHPLRDAARQAAGPRSQRHPVASRLAPTVRPHPVRVAVPPATLRGPVEIGLELLDETRVLLGMQRRGPAPAGAGPSAAVSNTGCYPRMMVTKNLCRRSIRAAVA
jgi:hypothetical protein